MKDIMECILSGSMGNLIIVSALFAGIVALLRFLYGPRGKFRDPRWHEGNVRMRMRESEERERRLRLAAEDEESVGDGR